MLTTIVRSYRPISQILPRASLFHTSTIARNVTGKKKKKLPHVKKKKT